MKIRMVGLVVCVSSLVGCGTGTLQKEGDFIRKGELFRAAMQKTDAVQKGGTALTAARLSSEEESILAERLSQAQKEADDICSEVVGARSRLADKRAEKTLWISIGGLVAGSVIAPALTAANASGNAAWISAFSGAGGASALTARTIDNAGYSGAADARIANDISAKVKEQMAIGLNESNIYSARYAAFVQAKVECNYYQRPVYRLEGDPQA
tara:strand:+ start:44207 stop:44842 length:636 start_codon:yes stop_codon:yes gene_type:complete